MMRLLVPISASLYHTNCLESWWTQEHGCDSVVLVSVASGIGWATGRFLAGESLHGLLGYSVEVNIFQWPALKRQEFLSSHSRRSRLVMMRLLVPMSASLYQPTVWNSGGLKNMDVIRLYWFPLPVG
ncbi:hypothetical protein CLU79DRAFT_892353 [Phycomyces nitens]|nr:hypothetical protein CLU79DRAFT_892353 [Phycomyces nitens]